jgi:DNA repair exonuclease SbcCD ATPase subunit
MSKIICERVELKNFLSYGNQWTTLDFKEGINAIIGHDEDKDRSNGAGKTSIIESIPFALFGQTSKEVSLNKIVNWKNGKNCEVKLHFQKDGIPYVIHRGIKPGILSLSKDGVDQPLLSDKRFFQKELEQDLIGMDFRFAQMMTFQNANNMISMFTAKKEEKRKFIEKFFNLEMYTKMNELVNKKLGALNEKLSSVERDIEYKEKRASELQVEIDNTTTIDLTNEKEKLTFLMNEWESIDVDTINSNITSLKGDLEAITGSKLEIEDIYNKRYERYVKLKEDISSLTANLNTTIGMINKIGDLTEQKSLYERVKSALEKMVGLESEYEECKRYVDGRIRKFWVVVSVPLVFNRLMLNISRVILNRRCQRLLYL